MQQFLDFLIIAPLRDLVSIYSLLISLPSQHQEPWKAATPVVLLAFPLLPNHLRSSSAQARLRVGDHPRFISIYKREEKKSLFHLKLTLLPEKKKECSSHLYLYVGKYSSFHLNEEKDYYLSST